MAAEDVAATGADPSELESGGLLHEIFTSPLNLLLLGLCVFLLYKIVRGDQPAASNDSDDDEPPPLPRLKRRDFTPAELRRFDGVQDPRILMAINGKVFDVTKGRKFYGPGNCGRPGDAETKEGALARGWGEVRGERGTPEERNGRPSAAVDEGRSRRAATGGGRRQRRDGRVGGTERRLERPGRGAAAGGGPEGWASPPAWKRGHGRAQS